MQPWAGSKRWMGLIVRFSGGRRALSLAAGLAVLGAARAAVACSCLASTVESSCELPENDYLHVDCVGHGECPDALRGWHSTKLRGEVLAIYAK